MKKIIIALLLCASFGYAQDCKFKEDKIDPFTKNRVLRTNERVLVDEFRSSVIMGLFLNKDMYIKTTFSFSGNKAIAVNESCEVLFLLKNEEVIKYPINEFILGKTKGYGSPLLATDLTLNLNTSVENLIKIRDIGISKIRLQTTEGFVDYEVKSEKNINKIKNIIDCFINEIKM